jgi:hypothetical protein
MNNFISNIISNHLQPVNVVLPRLPGRYESLENTPDTITSGIDTIQENTAVPSQGINISHSPKATDTQAEITGPSTVSQSAAIPVSDREMQKTDQQFLSADRDNKIKEERPPFIKTGLPVEEEGQSTLLFSGNYFNAPINPGESVVNPLQKNEPVLPANDKSDQNNWGKRILENNRENKDEPLFSLPVLALEKNEPIHSVVKPAGILGEPPGAKNFNNPDTRAFLAGEDSATNTAPIIKVSIGQISVRAVTQPPVVAKKITPVPQQGLSLEDYLKKRS